MGLENKGVLTLKINKNFFFILPVIVILLFIVVFPLIYSVYVSLLDYDLRKIRVRFLGIGNYLKALKDKRFIASLIRTGELVTISVLAQYLIGLSLALTIYYHIKRLRNLVVIVLSIPPMISPVVVGYMSRLIFHPGASPLNYMLETLGLPRLLWHASAQTSLLTVFLVDTWQWAPFMLLLLLSGLIAIPQEYIESARVDGASAWQEIRHIVLPLLKTTSIVAILFRSLDILRMFDVVYILTYGGPGTSTEVVSFYVYLTSFNYWRIGYGAALSWVLMLILSVLSTVYLKFVVKSF
ncbi:MAG: hypothetical protein DRJ41_03915 [Thermoprotei archaeon]|nr:MAG: hypothetical protein DRJ41_03915 [Thermoprotei archaeon]